MKNDRKIYFVKPTSNQSLDELYGIFDSLEKAEQFVARFKTPQKNVEIVTRIINPTYHTEKAIDPYCVTLEKLSIIPLDLFICNSISMAEDAKNESYNISFCLDNSEADGVFIFQCFATDKKEATSKTITKRDQLIRNGDWERAWVYYNLKRLSKLK